MALLHLLPSNKSPLLRVASPKIMKICSPGRLFENIAQVSDIKEIDWASAVCTPPSHRLGSTATQFPHRLRVIEPEALPLYAITLYPRLARRTMRSKFVAASRVSMRFPLILDSILQPALILHIRAEQGEENQHQEEEQTHGDENDESRFSRRRTIVPPAFDCSEWRTKHGAVSGHAGNG